MISWWIRIIELENGPEDSALFLNQEMSFIALHNTIEKTETIQSTTIFRYELQQTKSYQNQLVGIFTWRAEDGQTLLEGLTEKTMMAVKTNQFDKKYRKNMLRILEKELLQMEMKNKVPTSDVFKEPYPPENQTEKDTVEETISTAQKAVDAPPVAPNEDNREVVDEEITPQAQKKKMLIHWKMPTWHTPAFVPIIANHLKRFWKYIVGLGVGLILLFAVVYLIVPMFGHQTAVVEKQSFDTFLQKKNYKEMAQEYPKKFWEWEEEQVEKVDTDLLMDVYDVYPNKAIAFDIAFLGKAYNKVVTLYEQESENLRMNDTRYAFLSFSYLQENKLQEAVTMAKKTESQSLYGQIARAYLRLGKTAEAELYNRTAKDDAISKKIKDYQLVSTTLSEVNKQLAKKELNESIRKELISNKRALEDALQEIKEGKDE